MTAAIDITPKQRQALLVLVRRFIPGVVVWAYGSRVLWTARPNSDLDLVVFTSPAQRPLVSELKEALAESSQIPFLVDLHVWDEIPERFREIIRKEYVVLQEVEGSAIAKSEVPHIPGTHSKLPEGRSWSRLDAVCEGVFDCPHSTPKLTETGPLVVRTRDIITGIFRAEQAGHVSESTYLERVARATPRRGDLLYSREGTYFGIAAEVPEHMRICLGQRMFLIRPKKKV